jgi:hypothetical protein
VALLSAITPVGSAFCGCSTATATPMIRKVTRPPDDLDSGCHGLSDGRVGRPQYAAVSPWEPSGVSSTWRRQSAMSSSCPEHQPLVRLSKPGGGQCPCPRCAPTRAVCAPMTYSVTPSSC